MPVTYCGLVRPIACSLGRLCGCLRSPVEIDCLDLLLDMRLVRDRVLVMEDSYECNEDTILAVDDRTNWFFRLDMLDTVYGGEVLHSECQDRYIHFWPCCIQGSSTKSADSGQLLEAPAAVLVRELCSRRQDPELIAV